jgi:hypothetical protein
MPSPIPLPAADDDEEEEEERGKRRRDDDAALLVAPYAGGGLEELEELPQPLRLTGTGERSEVLLTPRTSALYPPLLGGGEEEEEDSSPSDGDDRPARGEDGRAARDMRGPVRSFVPRAEAGLKRAPAAAAPAAP